MPLKIALLIISLNLCACNTMPPIPEHTQYGIHANINPPGFYGVNSKTKARTYREFDDPVMKGGQCLSAEDFKKFQRYQKELKDWGEEHCK